MAKFNILFCTISAWRCGVEREGGGGVMNKIYSLYSSDKVENCEWPLKLHGPMISKHFKTRAIT